MDYQAIINVLYNQINQELSLSGYELDPVFLTVRLTFQVALFVANLVFFWMLFQKAGEKGWKALIPFYGTYTLYKVSGYKNLFFAHLISRLLIWMSFIGLLATGLTYLINRHYGEQVSSTQILIFAMILIASLIAKPIFHIIQCVGLSDRFRISKAFAIGLVILPTIFYGILAIGKWEYQKDTL